MSNRIYVCIDLKSFYASVECAARGLDPLTTNLVVADPDRTDKTICLAVSPSLKALGVKNRCRVFEIPKSLEYIMATPRMQLYIDVSASIYGIYLKYIAKEDIHVYSIDEVFMDVTDYLPMYNMTARELTLTIMRDILNTTKITATGGIGTNLYLAKVALDILAKHAPDHIGELSEESFKEKLWDHRPLTDFWRIGRGTENRLMHSGLFTMRDIAGADDALLERLFGVDGELIKDHALGIETVTMADIKAFKPKSNSLSSGQALASEYSKEDGRLIVKEMTDQLCLDLVDKGLITEDVSLYVRYSKYFDLPSPYGSIRLPVATSSSRIIIPKMIELYDRLVDENGLIKGFSISFNNVTDEGYMQYNLLVDNSALEKENKIQHAMLDIKKKYGKNAIVRGMNLEEKGTAMERNNQIGGHRK